MNPTKILNDIYLPRPKRNTTRRLCLMCIPLYRTWKSKYLHNLRAEAQHKSGMWTEEESPSAATSRLLSIIGARVELPYKPFSQSMLALLWCMLLNTISSHSHIKLEPRINSIHHSVCWNAKKRFGNFISLAPRSFVISLSHSQHTCVLWGAWQTEPVVAQHYNIAQLIITRSSSGMERHSQFYWALHTNSLANHTLLLPVTASPWACNFGNFIAARSIGGRNGGDPLLEALQCIVFLTHTRNEGNFVHTEHRTYIMNTFVRMDK